MRKFSITVAIALVLFSGKKCESAEIKTLSAAVF